MNATPDRRGRVLFWLAYATAWAALGTWLAINVIIGRRNGGQPIAAWEPMTWELSSVALMSVLAVAVYKFEQRVPLSGPQWWRRLPAHLVTVIGFSTIHPLGMVGIRQIVYALAGSHYD